jgi:hypothetical protein
MDILMIQKYNPTPHLYQNGVLMMPNAYGEYVKYTDHVKCMDKLVDKNFSLGVECCDLQQELISIRLAREDLIQIIVGLNLTIVKKECEITAISDRLNKTYLSPRANKHNDY